MKTANLYKRNEILTAGKGQIVVKLYEGAIKYLKLVIKDIESNDYESKSKHYSKAVAIIFELNQNRDMEKGGEISGNLRSLYLFMIKYLIEANLELDCNKIFKVIEILEELNQGWRAIAV